MAQRYAANLDELDRTVSMVMADFGLDSPSRAAPTVGDRAADSIAAGIHGRGQNAEGPDGAWRPNAESTIRKKGFDFANHETGQMLSEDQILGEVTVTHAT